MFCPSVSGGNIVHRLKGALEKNTGIRNLNPSIGSHFSFSTNEMKEYNKGGADYTLHFQNAYHYSESSLINMKLMNMGVDSQYIFSIVCRECTLDVTDINIDIHPPGVHPSNNHQPRDPRKTRTNVIDAKTMGSEDQLECVYRTLNR